MMDEARWILITSTGDGQINTSYHRSEREALQAQSIALTGMTIEENEAAEQAYEAHTIEKIERARKEAKLRDPTKWEREQIEQFGKLLPGGMACNSMAGFTEMAEGGKVRDVWYDGNCMSPSYSGRHGESMEKVRGSWALKTRSSVKSARIIPPSEPPNG